MLLKHANIKQIQKINGSALRKNKKTAARRVRKFFNYIKVLRGTFAKYYKFSTGGAARSQLLGIYCNRD
jgi:hypothetical protein